MWMVQPKMEVHIAFLTQIKYMHTLIPVTDDNGIVSHKQYSVYQALVSGGNGPAPVGMLAV